VRYLFKEEHFQDQIPDLGRSLADELLEPHRSYLSELRLAKGAVDLLGIAHITGGGLKENVPRCLPEGLAAEIQRKTWTVPPIFSLIESRGVRTDEMWRTFNMGIGMVLIVRETQQRQLMGVLDGGGAVAIGRVVEQRGPERLALV